MTKLRYWLMKSEPHTFSIDDLKNAPKQTEHWDGVRNYQARNFMRDDMKYGDWVLFYHSSCPKPAVVGLAQVSKEAYPDHTSWDSKSPYFDIKSTQDHPRWFMVDIQHKETFKNEVSLKKIKEESKLQDMRLIQKGNRLSIMPVEEKEFKHICKLAKSLTISDQ